MGKVASLIFICISLGGASAFAKADLRYSPKLSEYKKWSSLTTITHWNPSDPASDWKTTELSASLTHRVDEKNTASFWIGAKNRWLEKEDRESGTKQALIKDIAFTHSNEFSETLSLGTSIYLPTSLKSQTAGRRFILEFAPTTTLAYTSDYTIRAYPEIAYFNNAFATKENKPNADGYEYNETYSLAFGVSGRYYFSKNWSLSASTRIAEAWCDKKKFDRTQSYSFGPSYMINKNVYTSLSYYSSDDMPNKYPIFNDKISSLGLSISMSL
jgi:hypothetical protein